MHSKSSVFIFQALASEKLKTRELHDQTEQQLCCKLVPEAAFAVQVSITGVTAESGILVADAAPRELFVVTV